MYKWLKKLISIFMILLISIIVTTSGSVNSVEYYNIDNENKREVKVGFYSCYPVYFINEELNYDGYYHDVMEFISKKMNLDYKYVELDLYDALTELYNNNIDLLFGISRIPQRKEYFIYSKYHINTEKLALYSKRKIKFGDLEALNGQKIGVVKYDYASNMFLNELKSQNIGFELVQSTSFDKLIYDFKLGNVDYIVHFSKNHRLDEYNEVYTFSGGPVYIATSKENLKLMNDINELFESYKGKKIDPIKKMRDRYFNKLDIINEEIVLIFFILIVLTFGFVIYISYKKYLAVNKMKVKINKINNNLINNNFFLVYQPIVDPKMNIIKGFEALLRLNENGKIVSPANFLKDIEEVGKMDVVSFWILKQVLNDYDIIKDYKCIKEKFYVSINISYKEIENDKFIERIKEFIVNSTLNPNSICLEIVENVAINDLLKVQKVIDTLKNLGFMVAIDDFGVEYSNLDILEKIDCDIIKLDKFFIDEIEHSSIRREVVKFVSTICNITNKVVVCEGVENKIQRDIIKSLDNEKIYIQGYYYSKPLSLEQLKRFYIEKDNN